MKLNFFYLPITILIISCLQSDQPKPRPTPIVVDSEYCQAAQENLQKLKCPEGATLPNGDTFKKFCETTQKAGIFINPHCLSTITSCSLVDQCTGTSK